MLKSCSITETNFGDFQTLGLVALTGCQCFRPNGLVGTRVCLRWLF